MRKTPARSICRRNPFDPTISFRSSSVNIALLTPLERFPRTTFTGSVEEAIATAKELAGDKFVTIASADIIQQALNLGLVDELCISQVPVLFGSGISYFGELVGGHVMLEDPVVVQGTRALHLRYAVRR